MEDLFLLDSTPRPKETCSKDFINLSNVKKSTGCSWSNNCAQQKRKTVFYSRAND